MVNKKGLYIIIVILVLIVIGGGIYFFGKGAQKEKEAGQPAVSSSAEADKIMVVCSEAEGFGCFMNRMNGCLPVTVKGTGSDGKTVFEITILGVENEKCHFQRKINDVMDLNCYFPKGTMNWDTIDQTFGNDKGLQKVVDDACKKGW